MVIPASVFFSEPELRRGQTAVSWFVYGPAHLLRAAWLAGVQDYLKDPWTEEELFLRVRGPRPTVLEWSWGDRNWRLEGQSLELDDGPAARLSSAEAAILGLLVQRRGLPVSRNILAWAATCSSGRVIDTLVCRLRQKIQRLTPEAAEPIMSVRGLGYRVP